MAVLFLYFVIIFIFDGIQIHLLHTIALSHSHIPSTTPTNDASIELQMVESKCKVEIALYRFSAIDRRCTISLFQCIYIDIIEPLHMAGVAKNCPIL